MPEPVKEVQLSAEFAQQMIDNDRCSVMVDAALLQDFIETGDASPQLIDQFQRGLKLHDDVTKWLRDFIEREQQEATNE